MSASGLFGPGYCTIDTLSLAGEMYNKYATLIGGIVVSFVGLFDIRGKSESHICIHVPVTETLHNNCSWSENLYYTIDSMILPDLNLSSV